MCHLPVSLCIHYQCNICQLYLLQHTPIRVLWLTSHALSVCLLHSAVTVNQPEPDCIADSTPQIHSWLFTLTPCVKFARWIDCRRRYGISENITSVFGWGCNTPWLSLDGIVCLQASQVVCMQKEVPPCSSAWCWQTLKFIAPLIHFFMLWRWWSLFLHCCFFLFLDPSQQLLYLVVIFNPLGHDPCCSR